VGRGGRWAASKPATIPDRLVIGPYVAVLTAPPPLTRALRATAQVNRRSRVRSGRGLRSRGSPGRAVATGGRVPSGIPRDRFDGRVLSPEERTHGSPCA
jgi:hypothetical protein